MESDVAPAAPAVVADDDALGSELNSTLTDDSSGASAAEDEDEHAPYADVGIVDGVDDGAAEAAGDGEGLGSDAASSPEPSSSEMESDSAASSEGTAEEAPDASLVAAMDSEADDQSVILTAALSDSDAASGSDEESEISEGASAHADVAGLL